ncbi:MAG: hypothetical protein QOI66_2010 [Myxococcales bacterium]|nr:hypothetical protein [Myxococcales bacterium]
MIPLVWSLTEAAGLAMLIAGMVGHDVETAAVERPLIGR